MTAAMVLLWREDAMIAILSPAMRMAQNREKPWTEPMFFDRAEELRQKLCLLAPHELESALNINPKLALFAHAAFAHFDANHAGVAAAFSYRGLCYRALRAPDMTREELGFLQNHARILSAFYGLLRPMDGMQPHRLEMRTKGVPDCPDLYAFWGDSICRALYRDTDCVLSLCSREYERAVRPHVKPPARFVRCSFLLPVRGKWLMKATDVKIARGTMARYIAKNRIKRPQQIAAFNELGYAFAPYRSSADHMVFIRTGA